MAEIGIAQRLRERWQIASDVLIADTPSSLVYRVTRHGASPAIVKMLKPKGVHERPGIDYLDWRDGHGAAKLHDRTDDACLIEDAGTLTLSDYYRQNGDEAATDVVLDVLARLHAPSQSPPPTELVPLRQHFRALFDGAGCQAPGFGDTLCWTAALAEKLLAEETNIRPLHGDLHHDNIVSGGPRGWLAIDPQGLIGDAAYDVANVFGNPLGGARHILDPARIMRLGMRFSTALDCSPEKILRYAAAHAGLSICWSMEGEASKAAQENIAERLTFAKLARQRLDALAQR